MNPAGLWRAWTQESTRSEFRVFLFACWLLVPTCISPPGRSGPLDLAGFDAIAIFKLACRFGSLLFACMMLLRLNANPRTIPVVRRLAPLGLFAIWCAISFVWSPLKTITLGHSMELMGLLLLSVCAGILTDSEERRRTLFLHLFLMIFAVILVVLALELPQMAAGERPVGYMHPNALGALSTIGLILLMGCRFLWNWRWTKALFLPGIAVLALAGFLARSRSSLLATAICLGVLFWARRRRGLLLLLLVIAGGLLALAPFLESVSDLPNSVYGYVMRGQTKDDLMGASGRDELWGVALRSFTESPLFGHGYYMLSPSGKVYVWLKDQYQTAHSLPLHVLTGTGVFGMLLFLWGCASALAPAIRQRKNEAMFLGLLMAAFALIIGLFELSILGPIDPIGVVFFVVLGVVAVPMAREGESRCAS